MRRQQDSEVRQQPCPYNMPWVKEGENTCFACTSDRPLFNLGARKCEKDCTEFSNDPSFVLNIATHTCGYNTNCPPGQYFDETTRKCSIAPTYTN